MENKNIKRLYELVQSDELLKNRLLQIDKRYADKELTYENFLDVVNNNIIPIAKEYGITLTQEDIISKTKAGLNKLSDEDLLDVSGGISPRMAALTLSTIFLMSLGSGSISYVSALGSSEGGTSTSSSVSRGVRSTGKGLLSILKSLPSSLKLGIQKMASLFKKKDAERVGDSIVEYPRLDSVRRENISVGTSSTPDTGAAEPSEEVNLSAASGSGSIQYESAEPSEVNSDGEEQEILVNNDRIAEEAADISKLASKYKIAEEDTDIDIDIGEEDVDGKFGEEINIESQSIDVGSERKEEGQMYSREQVKEYCNFILSRLSGALGGQKFSKQALNHYIEIKTQEFCARNIFNYVDLVKSLQSYDDLNNDFNKALSEHLTTSSASPSSSDETSRMNELLKRTLDKLEEYLQNPHAKIYSATEIIKQVAPSDFTEIETYFSKHPDVEEKFYKAYDEIREKAIRESGKRVQHKVADQRDSNGKRHTPLRENSSKGSQAKEDMAKTLNETLTKIRNERIFQTEPTPNTMVQDIKLVEPEKYKSILKYLEKNSDSYKNFYPSYVRICYEVNHMLNNTDFILDQINKKEATKLNFDVEKDVKSILNGDVIDRLNNKMKNYAGLSKKFRHDINHLYKRKISSILRRQGKNKSIEEIAKAQFKDEAVAKNFIKKAKDLGFVKEIKNESIKDTGANLAHRHSDKNKEMQTSSKGHSIKTRTDRRVDENKALQKVEAKHKQSEDLKAGSEKSQKRHHHHSKDGHGKHVHAVVPLRYEELLQIAQSAIQGLAVGDAAGVPFEFKSREKIEKRDLPNSKNGFTKPQGQRGWWGGSHWNLSVKQGFWSDDTSMTLCLMSSIVDNDGRIVPNDVMQRFSMWASKEKDALYAPEGTRFDIGNQVVQAVVTYKSLASAGGGIKGTFKATPNTSAGNGALMRIMPMAFYLAAHPEISEAEGIKLIKDIAELTHNDVASYSDVGCIIYTLMNKNLILDKTDGTPQDKLKRAFNAAIESTKRLCSEELKKAGDEYRRLLEGYDSFEKIRMDEIKKENGFTPVTLESVMYSLIHSSRYMDCIRTAILMGYDTDTVASIAGGTAGILYKLEAIPQTCKEQLAKATDKDGKFVSIEQCIKDFIDAIFLGKK